MEKNCPSATSGIAVDIRKASCSVRRGDRGFIAPATHLSPLKIPSGAFFGEPRIIHLGLQSLAAPLTMLHPCQSSVGPSCIVGGFPG